jgi:hypothetical protein
MEQVATSQPRTRVTQQSTAAAAALQSVGEIQEEMRASQQEAAGTSSISTHAVAPDGLQFAQTGRGSAAVDAPTTVDRAQAPSMHHQKQPAHIVRLTVDISGIFNWASQLNVEVVDGMMSMRLSTLPNASSSMDARGGDSLAADLRAHGHLVSSVEVTAVPEPHELQPSTSLGHDQDWETPYGLREHPEQGSERRRRRPADHQRSLRG